MQKKFLSLLTAIAVLGSANSFADNNSLQPSNASTIKSINAISKDQNNDWIIGLLFIGKKVVLQSSMSALYKNEGLQGVVLAPQAAENVTVSIMDDNHNVVKTINLGSINAPGLVDFKWDGHDNNGNQGQLDFYRISATGSVNGKQVVFQTAGAMKVNSVAMQNNQIVLNIDGTGSHFLTDVIKVF